MLDYQRPSLPELVFHDERGVVIPYGQRWAAQGWDGPDDTYSVTAHPERFAPLVEVARAIIEHLTATYDVSRTDTNELNGVTRVRLVPRVPSAAPLEFTFHPDPRVNVIAGINTDVGWFCPCDHCDEDVQVLVGVLEQEISAVVEGKFREWLNDPEQGYGGNDLFLAYKFRTADGVGRGGSGSVGDRGRPDLRTRFKDVPPQWAPWTRH